MEILVAWIGMADLRASTLKSETDIGPVAQALTARSFDRVLLLANQEKKQLQKYEVWLRGRTPATIEIDHVELSSPTAFGEIYTAVIAAVDQRLSSLSDIPQLTFHLSPGTPAMAAVWIILGKTRYSAELIESSREHGVRSAAVPFDISAELIPDLLRGPDKKLSELSSGVTPEAAQFGDIIYRSSAMKSLVQKAQKAALRSVPVLIEGESGTGKELLARAIHAESPRGAKPLSVVNCGAIPAELVESELFGHEKGAFSGAIQARTGYFEAADSSTLFLDEIGELPLPAQVKLLRVLQEGEVTRVGATRPQRVDVRIIAATNRDLVTEVAEGRFREDLFYRLAVLILKMPPLRQREGDLGPLISGLLERINTESTGEPGFVHKKLSARARNILMQQPWIGNVRELQNTLRRAAVWSENETISADDIAESLLPLAVGANHNDTVLNRPIEEGIDLNEILRSVACHYMERALEATHGNRTKAAELVGLSSYQTLTNWMKKYDLKV